MTTAVLAKPMTDENPPSSSYNELTVYAVRTSNPGIYQIWVQNTVEGFNQPFAKGSDAFFSGNSNDPMMIVRIKWAYALAKGGFTENERDEINSKILEKLGTDPRLDSLAAAAAGGRELIVTKGALPGSVGGRTDPTVPGRLTVTLDLDKISQLELDEHEHHFDNAVIGTVLHEMLHVARPELLHTASSDLPAMNPENPASVNDRIWGDFVQGQRTDSQSTSYDWLTVMDQMGRALGLINDNNARGWWPIVVDLDNSGANLVGKSANVKFDVHGTGNAVSTGWVAAGASLLVVDWNHDGRISTGAEISFARFGNDPHSDLEGLLAFDQNHDGRIDARDPIFQKLQIWTDRNGDGVSTPDELKSLEQAGIEAIDLNIAKLHRLVAGNVIAGEVKVHLINGQIGHAYDVGFIL